MNILESALRARQAGFDGLDRTMQSRARRRAGQALGERNYDQAANELYTEGMIDEGSQVQNYGQAQDDRASSEAARVAKERGEALIKVSGALLQVQQGGRRAVLDRVLPVLKQGGMDTTILDSLSEDDLTDEDIRMFAGQVSKELEQFTLDPGDKRFDETGRLIAEAPFAPSFQKLGPSDTLIETTPGGGAAAGSGQAAPGGGYGADDVWGAAIMQESGGRPGVLGEPTEYGQAQGLTQMLPETAQEMAGKLGLPWRPELMTGTSEEAAAYQERLGRAYFDEGLQKYDGDVEKALMYYHGGPDESLWGPKTQAHAKAVMGRLQSAQTAGPGAPTGGARVIAQGAPKPGYRAATAEEKTATGIPAEVPAQVSPDGKIEPINIPGAKSGRISATALNLQNDHLDALRTASTINSSIGRFADQIASGGLNLGPVSNILASGRNLVGRSDQNSRNFQSFKANLEKLRNDSLRLNKGVQTEGDAQRAWNELLANINDEGVVQQRLAEIMKLNELAITYRQDAITQLREDSGLPPIDTNKFVTAPGASTPKTPPRPNGRPSPKPAAAGRPAAPKVGEVRKGYRYQGGDPSKPSSWTRVQ